MAYRSMHAMAQSPLEVSINLAWRYEDEK